MTTHNYQQHNINYQTMEKNPKSAEVIMLEECIDMYNNLIIRLKIEKRDDEDTIKKLKAAKGGIEYALDYIKDNLNM